MRLSLTVVSDPRETGSWRTWLVLNGSTPAGASADVPPPPIVFAMDAAMDGIFEQRVRERAYYL